jgi:hypothetical protein
MLVPVTVTELPPAEVVVLVDRFVTSGTLGVTGGVDEF